MSTVQLIVPSVPVFGSFLANSASIIGVVRLRGLQRAQFFDAIVEQVRERGDQARHALSLAVGRHRHVEGVVARVFISISSFMPTHTGSRVRMSIDSDLASAPSPRGCSAAVHPHLERMVAAVGRCARRRSRNCRADARPCRPSRTAAARSGRPGQRREASAGCGAASSGCDGPGRPRNPAAVSALLSGVTDSTEPSTLLGR